jgi:hypothetical protein
MLGTYWLLELVISAPTCWVGSQPSYLRLGVEYTGREVNDVAIWYGSTRSDGGIGISKMNIWIEEGKAVSEEYEYNGRYWSEMHMGSLSMFLCTRITLYCGQ